MAAYIHRLASYEARIDTDFESNLLATDHQNRYRYLLFAAMFPENQDIQSIAKQRKIAEPRLFSLFFFASKERRQSTPASTSKMFYDRKICGFLNIFSI